MRETRRIKRMSRNKTGVPKINLTSLMDVFTILVFFLLVNSGSTELLEAPRQIVLPESIAEMKPRETVLIYINKDEVLVQGQPVVRVADILTDDGRDIEPIMARLAQLQDRVIGVRTRVAAASNEVTILADKSIPFDVIRRVMSSCTAQGYERISLAVILKESQTTQI